MKVQFFNRSDFLILESDARNKILIDICDRYQYGVTETNQLYSQYYTKPAKNFRNTPSSLKKYGDIFFTEITSYQILCHMICVDWPKSITNMMPFKINYFRKCCRKLNEYCKNNNIKLLNCTIFGIDILEGSWTEILQTMNDIFDENIHLCIIK